MSTSVLGMSLCWRLLEEENLDALRDSGLRSEMIRGYAQQVYEYIVSHYREYGRMPTRDTLLGDLEIDPEDDFDPDEPLLYYADRIVANAALKEQREYLKEMRESLQDRDPERIYEGAKKIVRESSWRYGIGGGRLTNLKEAGQSEWERYVRRRDAEDGILGIRSGFDPIDQETGGFQPGGLTTIVARLGVGKSWLALILADRASRQGCKVGFVSLEMEEEAIQLRRRAIAWEIPYRDLKRGELDSATEERLREYLLSGPHPDEPDWFIASSGRVTDIAEAEMFVEETAVDLLIVDGIYLMSEGNSKMPMHERTMLAIRGLKRLGQRKGIHTVATAQFNRNVKKGSMQSGTENIGHSDAIGQDSDNVFGLFRDSDMIEAKQMQLSILKVRDGVPRDIVIDWDFERMSFGVVDSGFDDDLHVDDVDDGSTLF